MRQEREMHTVMGGDGKWRLEPVHRETKAEKFVKDLHRGLEELTLPMRSYEDQIQSANQTMREIGRLKAQREAEAVARQEATLHELASLRQSVQRAEQLVAESHEREVASDLRAQEAQVRSARDARMTLKLTAATVVLGAVAIIQPAMWITGLVIFAVALAIIRIP